VIIRKGKRITVLDVDPPTAPAWAKTMTQCAERVAGPEKKA